MPADYQAVLDFWFSGEDLGSKQQARWWQKQPAIDEAIRQRFAELIPTVHDSLYKNWSNQAASRLAAIICLDQFPRNIYRDSAQAFHFDKRALSLTLDGLDQQQDQALPLLQRTFFMMPLMHDESMTSQDRSVAFYDDAVALSSGLLKNYLQDARDFAIRHRDIISQFGRYPHRNRLLGRASTPAEQAFLKQPGSSF